MKKMKRVLLFVGILFLVTCKESTKEKKEEIKLDAEKKIETIEDYLNFDKKGDAVAVNNVVGDSVRIESLSVFKDRIENVTYLVVKLSEKIDSKVIDNNRINIRTFPVYLDDLREDSEARNLKYDSWYTKIVQREIKGDNYFIVNLSNSEGKFEKIIFQLIENGTNKISTNKVYVRDVFVRGKNSKK